jgi:hypothetical protein
MLKQLFDEGKALPILHNIALYLYRSGTTKSSELLPRCGAGRGWQWSRMREGGVASGG